MTASDSLADLRARLGDRYLIERELGRGGMGAVFLARDRRLDRPVALKVLPPAFAAQADLRERFLRETRLAAGFSHPNIVPVFAVEEADGLLAFAMGFVEGESLAQRVRRTGPLGARDAVRLLQDVGYALAYAHGRGVVHRDIKPDNIMLERATGRALLMDFGIARSVAPEAGAPGLTRVGEVVGTPEFMSPEQASGDHVDGRSDLYSLGLVAWFALTGEPAITEETTHKILVRQLTQVLPGVATRRPDLPAALAEVVDRCVRKDPAARFADAAAMVDALEAAQLAAPEVPLPVRLLAQDLGQLGLVAGFLAVIIVLMQRLSMVTGRADLDIALPAVFLAAVLWGRTATAVDAARRVLEDGFTPADVMAGFRRVLEERAADRARLRTLAAVRARRRRTVRAFVAVIGAAILLTSLAWAQRVELAPGIYRVGIPWAIVLAACAVMSGIAVIGLLRSPFRAGPGERLFRLAWTGLPGRLLLAVAGRGLARGGVAVGTASVAAPSPAVPAPVREASAAAPPLAERMEGLERRVAELEAWRAGAAPPPR